MLFSWMNAILRDVYSTEGNKRNPLSFFGGNVSSMRHSGYNLYSLVCVICVSLWCISPLSCKCRQHMQFHSINNLDLNPLSSRNEISSVHLYHEHHQIHGYNYIATHGQIKVPRYDPPALLRCLLGVQSSKALVSSHNSYYLTCNQLRLTGVGLLGGTGQILHLGGTKKAPNILFTQFHQHR